jgi:hypothetical protein
MKQYVTRIRRSLALGGQSCSREVYEYAVFCGALIINPEEKLS